MKKDDSSLGNYRKVKSEVQERSYGLEKMRGMGVSEPNSLSEDNRSPLTAGLESQQYNALSTQKKAQNWHNVITLSKISEEEKIDIIKTGLKVYF